MLNCPRMCLFLFAAFTGCHDRHHTVPVPPVPHTCSAGDPSGKCRFTFYKWQEGLAILFLDETGGAFAGSDVCTEKSYISHAVINNANGFGYDWRLETKDGKSASLIIQGESYDLAGGTVFRIQQKGSQVHVIQSRHELSDLDCTIDACRDFLSREIKTAGANARD